MNLLFSPKWFSDGAADHNTEQNQSAAWTQIWSKHLGFVNLNLISWHLINILSTSTNSTGSAAQKNLCKVTTVLHAG